MELPTAQRSCEQRRTAYCCRASAGAGDDTASPARLAVVCQVDVR